MQVTGRVRFHITDYNVSPGTWPLERRSKDRISLKCAKLEIPVELKLQVKVATNRISGRFRWIAWIGLILGIAMVPTLAWLADRPPTTNCNDRSWLNSSDDVIFASKVVDTPWYGRHNVYGVFVIPTQYRDTGYSATVIVRGVKEHTVLSPRPTIEHGVIIANVPDRYVKHAHIHTRVALWFLLTGHFGDLRATCNWALVITKKRP